MTEFDLEDEIIQFLISTGLYGEPQQDGSWNKTNAYLAGYPYKFGTRDVIRNEDTVVEVLSIDDKQFQDAQVSVRTYVNDLDGSPITQPNIGRLEQIAKKLEETFKTRNSSYALTTSKFKIQVSSVKRERREQLKQHCVNFVLNFLILNI